MNIHDRVFRKSETIYPQINIYDQSRIETNVDKTQLEPGCCHGNNNKCQVRVYRRFGVISFQ